ncbi:E1 ubiquitin-activating protein uba2 [Coemansia sp. RSA 1365]|nr:E1 ubiquitin-activating protein uba2 [Coemansia sp. RSA 1365]
MRTTRQLARIFGEETATRVSSARLLVVGAGGIGCELLKDLSMTGFQHIHAIDLDTIDLSNLNRQFLFQRKHIKRPKAEVAIKAIKEFNSGIDATATQANIKEPDYDVDWFSGFDLVLNALDNLDARRHVNTMCLAAHVPLIESGTAGYLGQVTVISGGKTECFECQPKAAERKTYPVCTIRSTPSAPIHCIVWAKDYLFAQLFGERVDEAEDDQGMDAEEKAENMEELKQLREESRALSRLTEAMGTSGFPKVVFEKVFTEDIGRLLSMKDMWEHRRPPTKLDFVALQKQVSAEFDPAHPDDQSILPVEDSCALFVYAANRLADRILDQQKQGGQRFLSFDKDDEDALNFVAATANLRSQAFGIEQKSIFAIKAMAGNIIPAIATTNAIVAGMMVMQAIMVLSQRMAECHTAYVSYNSKRARSIVKEPLATPNPRCPICRRRYLTLRVADCSQTTLGDVLAHVASLNGTDLDLQLGDDIAVVEGSRILYDPDFEDNLGKTLKSLGIIPGRMVTLTNEDDDEGVVVPVVLNIAKLQGHVNNSQKQLVIEGFEKLPKFAPLPDNHQSDNADAEDGPEDGIGLATNDQLLVDKGGAIIIDDTDAHASNMGYISDELSKRQLDDAATGDQGPSKRRALETDDAVAANSDDIVILD